MTKKKIFEKKRFFSHPLFMEANKENLRFDKNNVVSGWLEQILRVNIPPVKDFNMLKRHEQREVNSRLHEMFGMEKTFKTLLSLEHRGEYIGVSLQKEEFDKFDKEYKFYMSSKISDKPEKKEALIYHMALAVKIVKKNLQLFDKNLIFKESDVTIARSISSKVIFACFLSRVVSKAYKSFVTSKDKELLVHECGLSLKKTEVLYDIEREIIGHIITAVLRHASQKGPCLTETKLNTIFSFQFRSRSEVLPYAQKEVTIVTEILFGILERDNFLSDNTLKFDNSLKRKFKFYDLNPCLDPIISLTAQVPDLVKPRFDKEVMVKEIFAGTSEFKMSSKLLKAIDIANKTPYVVDEEALSFLVSQRESCSQKTYKLPFPNRYEEEKATKEVDRRINHTHVSLARMRLYRYITEVETLRLKDKDKNDEFLKHSGNLEKDKTRAKILSKTLLTNIEITHHHFCTRAKKEKQVNRQKVQCFETMSLLAEFFKGYTLYYPKFFDYRGRQLPKAWFAANTLGDMRYLVKIKDYYTINLIGLEEVFKAIYSNTLYTDKAVEYLCNLNKLGITDKKKYFQKLMLFVNENSLTQECLKKNFIYKTLLLNKFKVLAENKFKTWIYVERDQKSSSSVFLSLLLRNKKLASMSNLTGESSEIIGILQSRFKEYYASRIENSDKILSLFEKDRNLIKKGFMFLSYGQKPMNRAKVFKKLLTDEHGVIMNRTNYKAVNKISKLFEDFLDTYIEGFCSQLEILDQIFTFILKENSKYSTKTLDGAFLSWVAYDKPSTKVLTYYCPSTNQRRSFRHRVAGQKKMKLSRNLRGCKANLIHSFDGAIIREFSLKFKEKGYDILTIHDCVQYNPNAAQLFKEIVEDLYIDNNIILDFFDSAFTHPRKFLQEEKEAELDKLLGTLYETSGLAREDLKRLNYDKLYVLE